MYSFKLADFQIVFCLFSCGWTVINLLQNPKNEMQFINWLLWLRGTIQNKQYKQKCANSHFLKRCMNKSSLIIN